MRLGVLAVFYIPGLTPGSPREETMSAPDLVVRFGKHDQVPFPGRIFFEGISPSILKEPVL